jgi:serine/threonine-protein kinase
MQVLPVPTGTLLQDRYRLVGVAERTHFGQTYLARDQKRSNALCILKEFLPQQRDPDFLHQRWQQFNQRAAILYRLSHPQLPSYQALIAQDNRLFWVREYVEGKSYEVLLQERQQNGQAFSELEVLSLIAQTLPVLHYLHSHGVVHRNVNPKSLIQREEDDLPVLVNFGLVYELVAQLELHPVDAVAALGEWGYTPPEQLRGAPCPVSDLYALGMTAIALLAGCHLEELYNPETQTIIWESAVHISPGLRQLLRHMVAPEVQRRPTSALEISRWLQPLLQAAAQAVTYTPATMPPVLPNPALSGTPATVTPRPPRHKSARTNKSALARSPGGDTIASLLMGVGIILLLSVIGWRVATTWQGIFPQPLSLGGGSPAPTSSVQPAPNQQASPSAATKSNNLSDRMGQLGVDYTFFTQLVSEQFYEKYPQLRAQSSTEDAQQAQFQAEWNQIANSLMDRLEQLTPATRAKLGRYRREDYANWLRQLGETTSTSQRLDPIADARFYQLFPEMQGKKLAPNTFGQIWYAIAEEQLAQLK